MLKFVLRIAVLPVFALAFSSPSFAQAMGHVQVKFVKAALVIGGGGGNGVLTFRGRHYPFVVSGFSLGVSAGASASWLEGTASGIKDVNDFVGSYTAVGGGGAWVGGAGGISLRNEHGVVLSLKGPKAGLEFAANVSGLTISLK
ncbi:hypothetical protein AS156_28995 [Bradyrhizobium macuxiense]|uniref:DUF1134 domain-containing protein n=1 Tax=Bradyrhizobium macuxiense TaxID=1755647 RepID=A0A109K4H6_9BRAD|nr:hypothetical protein [Bradyrhizobium macuxiense]KWV60428.1 hypothetical protein AS156_28995 [Bradyrhizobium macuxiense]